MSALPPINVAALYRAAEAPQPPHQVIRRATDEQLDWLMRHQTSDLVRAVVRELAKRRLAELEAAQ